jgi:hypothetical protein
MMFLLLPGLTKVGNATNDNTAGGGTIVVSGKMSDGKATDKSIQNKKVQVQGRKQVLKGPNRI